MQHPVRTAALFAARVAAFYALGLVAARGQPVALKDTARAPRPLQLDDYFRLETVANPAISPDGRRVAFTRSRVVEAANRHHTEIWLASTDGSAPLVRLTDSTIDASAPRWSPDGGLLAFVSRRHAAAVARESTVADDNPIWFLRMDQPGATPFQVPGVSEMPTFSPDGRWMAFAKRGRRAKSAPEGSEMDRKIAQRFSGRVYDWMNVRFDQRGYLPDPRDSLATPSAELYVVARDGGSARQLTHLGFDVRQPAWSPNGRAIAFVADAHQRDEHSYGRADLWVQPLDRQLRRLTDDGFEHAAPAWSPDGQTLVFRAEPGLNSVIAARQSHGAAVDVYRMPSAGGAAENLTARWDLIPGEPSFDRQGRFVYFSAEVGGDVHLFRVGALGGDVEQVTHGARRLGGFTFAASADRAAYTASEPTHPTELLAARVDGSEERRLTGFNDALAEETGPSPARRIVYPSRDGTQVEGWVIVPRGYDPARRYPLILAMHGGPHGAYGTDYNFEFQFLAANGYAVLFTNPRGSTGYGEKFLWATWGGGWGNLDMEDVMAGVDYALAHYSIDPSRLGVTGYSYGGFLTNWVITHTTRFAAAITGAGISNWVSDYGTADIPRTKESEFFGAPWESKAFELLWRQSPLAYAGSVTTPTMFIHGEADLRVPIEQAEQMYTALQKRQVPARMVRYPDSYHGGWTPWNTVHRYDQELKWWSRWLGGRPAT